MHGISPDQSGALMPPIVLKNKSRMPRTTVDGRKSKIASRVLIVDDDPVIKDWLTSILEHDGYEVVSVRDGRQVYHLLQSDADFKGAVLNLSMPYLDGAELISYMRTEKRLMRIPVMLITTKTHTQDLVNGLAAGATVLLPKPFTKAVLQHVLRMMLHTKLEGEENTLPPAAEPPPANESARKVACHQGS